MGSEAENGVNLSGIKDAQLDALIRSLRTTTDKKAFEEVASNIEKKLIETSLFIPIASPLHTIYIDKNIK